MQNSRLYGGQTLPSYKCQTLATTALGSPLPCSLVQEGYNPLRNRFNFLTPSNIFCNATCVNKGVKLHSSAAQSGNKGDHLTALFTVCGLCSFSLSHSPPDTRSLQQQLGWPSPHMETVVFLAPTAVGIVWYGITNIYLNMVSIYQRRLLSWLQWYVLLNNYFDINVFCYTFVNQTMGLLPDT